MNLSCILVQAIWLAISKIGHMPKETNKKKKKKEPPANKVFLFFSVPSLFPLFLPFPALPFLLITHTFLMLPAVLNIPTPLSQFGVSIFLLLFCMNSNAYRVCMNEKKNYKRNLRLFVEKRFAWNCRIGCAHAQFDSADWSMFKQYLPTNLTKRSRVAVVWMFSLCTRKTTSVTVEPSLTAALSVRTSQQARVSAGCHHPQPPPPAAVTKPPASWLKRCGMKWKSRHASPSSKIHCPRSTTQPNVKTSRRQLNSTRRSMV